MENSLVGLLYLAILILGPLPLCLSFLVTWRTADGPHRFSHALVLVLANWCIIETAIGLLLGLMHRLYRVDVLIAQLTVFLCGTLLLVYSNRQHTLTAIANAVKPPARFNTAEIIIGGIIGGPGVFFLWYTITTPITDYDSLAYHLPIMAKWVQGGNLAIAGHGRMIGCYPFNWEVLAGLFLMPLREDILVTLPNFFAWLLFGLAIYRLAGEAGAQRVHAMAAAALTMGLPIIYTNIHSMHIDLPLAAFIMIGLYALVSYAQSPSQSHVLLYLGSLGMVLGIKNSGLVYGTLLLMAAGMVLLAKRYLVSPPRMAIVHRGLHVILSILWIVFFLFTGGYWYFRNLVQYGNPLGYLEIKLGGLVLFPGAIPAQSFQQTTLAYTFQPTHFNHWQILGEQVLWQLGFLFLLLVIGVVLYLVSFFTGRRSCSKTSFYVIAVLMAAAGLIYWMTPYSATNNLTNPGISSFIGQAMRFAFPFIGAIGIAAGAGFTAFNLKPHLTAILVILMTLLSWVYTPPQAVRDNLPALLIILIITGAIFLLTRKLFNTAKHPVHFPRRLLSHRIIIIFIIIIFISILTIAASVIFSNAREIRDVKRGLMNGVVWNYLERSQPPCNKIAYFFMNTPYLLYDRNLERQVVNMWDPQETPAGIERKLYTNGFRIIAVGPISAQLSQTYPLFNRLLNPAGPFERILGENIEQETILLRLK